jgi:CubicO group peptidase (beta-lactamase class C family)
VRGPDGSEGPASRPPTIRELLTHTSGLSYNFINNPRLANAYREAGVTDGLANPEIATAEAMKRLASVPLGYQPGTGWEYSLATDVLGAVIEKVTGGSLEAFITERIAKPLRIESFVFNAPEAIRTRFVQATRPAQVTARSARVTLRCRDEEAVSCHKGGHSRRDLRLLADRVQFRRRRHERHDGRLRALPADAAERRRSRRRAGDQGGDGRW